MNNMVKMGCKDEEGIGCIWGLIKKFKDKKYV